MALIPVRINPPLKGVNTVSPIRELTHDYAVRLDNIWMDKAASIQPRPGQATQVPPHASGIKELFEYSTQSGSSILFMQDNLGVIYRKAGNTWKLETNGVSLYSGKLGHSQLGSQLILGDNINEQFFNGSLWKTPAGVGQLGAVSNICNIFHPHNGRMYASGSVGYRSVVFFSDIQASGVGASAGVAQWSIDVNSPTGGYIDITGAIGKGETVTGISSFQGLLVVFTSNSVVFYNADNPIAALSVHKVIKGMGCISNNSIQGVGNTVIFLSQYGFLYLHEVLVQGDAAVERSSVAVNNYISDRIRSGLYNATNLSSTYAQSMGIYICSFGADMTWIYHEQYKSWTQWFGFSEKLLTSTNNELYGAISSVPAGNPDELVLISSLNNRDVVTSGIHLIPYTWETAPFRATTLEAKARWNRLEVIYEAESNAVINLKSWLSLDKAIPTLNYSSILNKAAVVVDPTRMKWATKVNGAVVPNTVQSAVWGGALNPLTSTWMGTGNSVIILAQNSIVLPLTGKSELMTMEITSTGDSHLRISALEIYRNEGSIR